MAVLSTLFSCFHRTSKTAQVEPPTISMRSALSGICGEDYVVLPSDSRYSEWSKSYNSDKPIVAEPVAVVRPRTAQEVAGVVKFAAENGYKLQAKSGGHSYANFCLGGPGNTNTITADLVELQKFSMDKMTWYATIGAGTLLGDVTTKLHDAGGRAFAHGVCPVVGIGGHATIGGLGPMSRMWGTCLDHVVEVEVVVADGRILRASQTQNADIFFGIRGAGAGFGIVTEFVMRTHPEPGNVVQYNYTFSFAEHNIAQVFKQWRDLAYDPGLDRRLGTLITITGDAAVIEAIFYGTEEEFQASGLPHRLPKPSYLTCEAKDWIGHLVYLAEAEALHASNIRSAFYHKSLGFRQRDTLSDTVVDKMVHYILNAPKGFHEVNLFIFSAQGGATNDVPVNATSYGHRDKVMFYENYIINTLGVSQENKHYFLGFHKLILDAMAEPKLIATTYAGYVDLDLGTGVKSGPAYWGERYPRLREVKTTWDPRDVFHNAQSVRPVGVDN